MSLNQEHELLTAIELDSFKGLLSLSKKLYISTKDIHFIYDLTVTEEDKINKIKSFKDKFDFFPDYSKNTELRDYFILNYENLVNTALLYCKNKMILKEDNSYYKYVLDFCNQYENHFFVKKI